jgi:hypothetical protein
METGVKRVARIVGCIVLAIVLAAVYPGYRIVFGKPFTINQLANRQVLIFLVRHPELFTQVGLADGTLLDWHSGKLSPVGVKKRDDDYALLGRFATEVRSFDRASLGRQDQITYDVLLDQYETPLAFKRFSWLSSIPSPLAEEEGLYPIAPEWGTQVQLASFLQSTHVVKNEKTARNYVKRLQAMGGKLDAVTAEMQRQAGLGVVRSPTPKKVPTGRLLVQRVPISAEKGTTGAYYEAAADPSGTRVHGLRRRLGALRGALGGRDGDVQGRSLRRPGPPAVGNLPLGAARGGHRHPCHGLDPRAGNHLHG